MIRLIKQAGLFGLNTLYFIHIRVLLAYPLRILAGIADIILIYSWIGKPWLSGVYDLALAYIFSGAGSREQERRHDQTKYCWIPFHSCQNFDRMKIK